MMHIAWSSIELRRGALLLFKVICQISRSHRTKIADFHLNLAFPDCNSSLHWPMTMKWCTKLEVTSICFSRSSDKFQGHTGQKITDFDPNWVFPNCNPRLRLINGYEMMNKAWSSIQKVPYCFSRSSIKYQGHIGQKIMNFNLNWAFPDCNSSLNSLMALK